MQQTASNNKQQAEFINNKEKLQIMRNSPKVVKVPLQQPRKNKKGWSPQKQIAKNPFNAPISKLKKTFADGTNFNTNGSHQTKDYQSKSRNDVFNQIQRNHKERIEQHSRSRRREQQLKLQQLQDREPHKNITQQQVQLCKQVFNRINKKNKADTEYEDLANLNDQVLKNIVKVAYHRKEKNNFFDFAFALWDTGSLDILSNYSRRL